MVSKCQSLQHAPSTSNNSIGNMHKGKHDRDIQLIISQVYAMQVLSSRSVAWYNWQGAAVSCRSALLHGP